MQQTPIGWTDYSANLLKYRNAEGKTVWACVHASEGCRFCYSEALAKRWGRGKAFTAENMKALTPYFDEDEANRLKRSDKISGKRVFLNDMTDWMGPWVDDDLVDRIMAVIASRPDVTFQTLTKHASRQHEYLTNLASVIQERTESAIQRWPLPNLHLGVSIEDQKNADERMPLLLQTPAAVHWASVEPLLGPIHMCGIGLCCSEFREYPLDGIVIGGESGHGHREMPLDSAISIAREAKEAGVAVYFKQDSGPRPGMQGRVPDDVWAMKEWSKAA